MASRIHPCACAGSSGAAPPRAVRFLFALGVLCAALSASANSADLERAFARAAKLPRLHALIVARDGRTLRERAFRGPGLERPANVKSVSKTVISALVGAAIERGVLAGTDAPVAGLLPADLPRAPDPRLSKVTVGHLLSMQAGQERVTNRNYGRWVASPNWVRFSLASPFLEEPGGSMLYSTGNSHLLSAILTRAAGRDTHALARDWLARPLGISIPPWDRDPQGIYFGGNNMAISPRALLAIGEMYRRGGLYEGRRVISEDWIRRSWQPRTRSPYSGHAYGYGWFITELDGAPAYYARGYGGQYLYVVPERALTIVITSDPTLHSRVNGYAKALRSLAEELAGAAG